MAKTAAQQKAYRQKTGDVMGRTRQKAMAELVERHRDEYEAILADLRRDLRK